jgi:hypothetical protein
MRGAAPHVRIIWGVETVKAIAVRLGVVVGAAVVAMALFGTGTSAAKDPYIGRTYKDASANIAKIGGNPVISTVVGSQLPTDECIVTSWHQVSYARRTHFDLDTKKYMLSLNCAAKLAHGGQPGNSLATAEGRAEHALEVTAAKYNNDPTRCEKNFKSCKVFCNNYGLCSKEVMALF